MRVAGREVVARFDGGTLSADGDARTLHEDVYGAGASPKTPSAEAVTLPLGPDHDRPKGKTPATFTGRKR